MLMINYYFLFILPCVTFGGGMLFGDLSNVKDSFNCRPDPTCCVGGLEGARGGESGASAGVWGCE